MLFRVPAYISNDIPEELSQFSRRVCVEEHWHVVVMPLYESRGRIGVDSEGGKYCIGLVLEAFDAADNELIASIDLLLDAQTFFRFPMENAKRLMLVYAEEDDTILLAEDMCVLLGLDANSLDDVVDTPICTKTYWIRIIQRKWKRIYRLRMELLRRRGGLAAQRRFELTGKWS